jgi:hypothetical protein
MANTICKPPPTSYKIRSLVNHFAKTAKYMTEESERYMDHPKVHKSPTILLDPESKGV